MAFTSTLNGLSPATGSVATYALYTMCLAAGATKVADSDGTTYSAVGTQVTSGASGANGLANPSAWFVMQLPSGEQLCFQRGTTHLLWRIKYSAISGFSGGSPGATRVPSAADESLRLGGGTDAAPTYISWWATDATYKLYGRAGGAADGFWIASVINAGGAAGAGMFVDPVTNANALDQAPAVIHISVGTSGFTATQISTTTALTTGASTAGWLAYGLGGACVGMSGLVYVDGVTSQVLSPSNLGLNAHGGGVDNLLMVQYGRRSSNAAPTGYKGGSSMFAWNGTDRASGETFSVATLRDRISIGHGSFRWDGSVVL